jgi:hypothetical protein
MQFRERNERVQLIRITYSKDEKKGVPEMIGRLSRSNMALPDDVKDKLTPDELTEVEAYIARRAETRSVELRYAVSQFHRNLDDVSEWLRTAGQDDVARFIHEIQKPLLRLRRQMAKALETGRNAD